MTWNCRSCDWNNTWWRDVCERCHVPMRGFDPPPEPGDPSIDVLRAAAMQEARSHLPGGLLGMSYCECCRPCCAACGSGIT